MKKRLLALGLAVVMIFSMAGCGSNQTGTGEQSTAVQSSDNVQDVEAAQVHKIGVAVYSTTDDEVMMFRDYYENYLSGSFQTEFYYSQMITSYQDELDFVNDAKEAGCEGIISFITYDIKSIVSYCAKQGMYYMMGSGTQSEDDFNAVKNEEMFLGMVGPSVENESEAGKKMIESLAGEDGSKKTYLILSGGSAFNNFMHRSRTEAMLNTLVSEQGFTLEKSIDELLDAQENILAATSSDGGKVYLCPGYLTLDQYAGCLDEALKMAGTVDVLASSHYASPYMESITAKETEQNSDIKVGAIDCFSETNSQLFHDKDAFGNSELNFIGGKCAAMAAPAFAAMYNAVTGHADTVKNNGEAFWLNQDFWYADDPEEYDQLSEEAENVYSNVYGTKDIMNVLAEYNENASYQDFAEFTEEKIIR